MGKYFTDVSLKELQESVGLGLEIRRAGDPGLSRVFARARETLLSGEEQFLLKRDNETLEAYRLIRDIDGEPALILKAEIPRDVYRQGLLAIKYLTSTIVVVGLLFSLVVYLLIEHSIVARLSRLGAGLEEIREEGFGSGRVPELGSDELAALGRDINRLLDSLHEAYDVLSSSESKYRNLSTHIEKAREEERRLLSRELHDELGQDLAALNMDLAWLKIKLPEGLDPQRDKLVSMEKLLSTSLEKVKRISDDLRHGIIDTLGLVPAIEYEARKYSETLNIDVKTELALEDEGLAPEAIIGIYRILQESLSNVARHASASEVRISLMESDGHIILEVSDNGRGIKEEQITDPDSFGLVGMVERAEKLGGSAVVRPQQGGGTSVHVVIPESGGNKR